jgi:aminoglycoside 6'-N-acetyltransferase I
VNGGPEIRAARASDAAEYTRMRAALWPDCTAAEHARDVDEFARGRGGWGGTPGVAFVADRGGGRLAGFVEVGLRAFAEGCDTGPVGYIEGWWVDADARRGGVGAVLVAAAEAWARAQGCREMASDCLLENDVSLFAHRALGYEEVERVIQFRKAIVADVARGKAR